MARVVRVARIANPRRGKARRKVATKRRRKMTPKQIKHFGTKAQRAALKRKRTVKRAAPKRKATRTVNPRRKRTRRNPAPAFVVTLGAVNPRKKGSTSMAKRRRRRASRKANPVRRRRRNRVTTVTAPRRRRSYSRRKAANPRRRRNTTYRSRRRSSRRRNPVGASARTMGTMILGGLAGVAAVKLIPRFIPAGMIPAGGGFIMASVVSGVAAYAAGWLAKRFMGEAVGNYVLFGGLMQTGSVVLNGILPGFKVAGVPLALSGGMGELMPGQFAVPQNPLRLPAPAAPVNARMPMNGIQRGYGSAY